MRITRLLTTFVLVLLVSGQAPSPTGATVTGTVQMVEAGKVSKDPKYLHVFLEEVKPRPGRPGKGMNATITQKGEQFDPHVVVIPVGGTVTFPNKDQVMHNVFSPWIDAKRVGFDLGLYGRSKGKSHTFLESGEFAIYCDVHQSMWARVKVVPTLYSAQVDKGTFKLTGVAPGTYKVVAWSPGSDHVKSETITIKAAGTHTVQPMNLQANPLSTEHSKKDGSDYPLYNEK